MANEPSPADRELLETAVQVLRERYTPGAHRTAAAVRTEDGAVYTSVSFKAATGIVDLHAEPLAVARAALDDAGAIETIVAVQPTDEDPATPRVVSACGACREFLRSYAPAASLLVDDDGHLVKVPLEDLLPAR